MKQIREEINRILNKYNVEHFFNITICENAEETKGQIGKGRPGPNTKYESLSKTRYLLEWELNKKRLRQESNLDGIFPLFTTDKSFSEKRGFTIV